MKDDIQPAPAGRPGGNSEEQKPAGVPLLDLKQQYAAIREELDQAVRRVCESQYFILGPEVTAFEEACAGYCGCRFAVGVSSGTDALLAAMMAAGIGHGDEVITTPYTFFATAGCIARLGARPVFVDIDPVSFNIDPRLISDAVTERTKAILPVHLYGQMADMDPLLALAGKHGLLVIEDAAQAIGSELAGVRAGSMGDMGCFSFFPSKNLGGFGDGGLVTTNDEALAAGLRACRMHGSSTKYLHETVGGNFRLDALQAAVLMVKLNHLDSWTAGRQLNAERYNRLFTEAALAGGEKSPIKLPNESPLTGDGAPRTGGPVAEGHRHIYNQYVIRCRDRDGLRRHLTDRQIGSEIYYPVPLHLQECFASLGLEAGLYPESERAALETLALPIFPELGDDRIARVADAVARYYEGS